MNVTIFTQNISQYSKKTNVVLVKVYFSSLNASCFKKIEFLLEFS